MQNTFGDFLRIKRQEKSLTQKELASILMVSESAVSKWEKDVARPDITLLPKLSEVLSVTEHELITASVDLKTRKERIDAKRWRALSTTWSLFFYISYIVALIPCFICDLAINGKFSWFYIVLASLILAFTFTNLPKIIKKHKLILLPLFEYLALCLLLAVCCIYTGGNWFFIPAISVFLGLTAIFLPIFICKYSVFSKIKKYCDFLTVLVVFVLIEILLLVIENYTLVNGYSSSGWYFKIALPITALVYLILNLCLIVRFLSVNKLIKTSIVLSIVSAFSFLVPPLIKSDNLHLQKELDEMNIFKANLSDWRVSSTLENNVWLLTFLTMLALILIFLTVGLLLQRSDKNNNK